MQTICEGPTSFRNYRSRRTHQLYSSRLDDQNWYYCYFITYRLVLSLFYQQFRLSISSHFWLWNFEIHSSIVILFWKIYPHQRLVFFLFSENNKLNYQCWETFDVLFLFFFEIRWVKVTNYIRATSQVRRGWNMTLSNCFAFFN